MRKLHKHCVKSRQQHNSAARVPARGTNVARQDRAANHKVLVLHFALVDVTQHARQVRVVVALLANAAKRKIFAISVPATNMRSMVLPGGRGHENVNDIGVLECFVQRQCGLRTTNNE